MANVWRKTIEAGVQGWWKTLEDARPATGRTDQSATRDLGIVTAIAGTRDHYRDSGSCANWFARDPKMRRGMKASLSGGLASMGAAVPIR